MHVAAWWPLDVHFGVGETPMTRGIQERMEGGVVETSMTMLDQQSNKEGMGKGCNEKAVADTYPYSMVETFISLVPVGRF